MNLPEKLKGIINHDTWCASRDNFDCDCRKPKLEKQLLAAFREYVREMKPKKELPEKDQYALCIECKEPVRDRGLINYQDSPDGWFVSACDNPDCKRYGLITTVTC